MATGSLKRLEELISIVFEGKPAMSSTANPLFDYILPYGGGDSPAAHIWLIYWRQRQVAKCRTLPLTWLF